MAPPFFFRGTFVAMRHIFHDSPFKFGFAMGMGGRSRQEDFACVDGNVFAVLDGMGGHHDGDEASRLAGEGFVQGDTLSSRLQQANIQLCLYRREVAAKKPMTTIVAVEIFPEEIMFGWLGDSRGYLLSGDVFYQVTEDHTKFGAIEKCLGLNDAPEYTVFPWKNPSRVLLCTDGLSSVLPFSVLEETLKAHADPQACADALMDLRNRVETANPHIQFDNATVLVIDT